MTDHEQRRRREQLLQRSRDAQEMWEREIASPAGPLPGAVLDVLEHGNGWVGHVQLATRRPASDIDKAATAIEKAWDLLPGSVVVNSGGSEAELWVYEWPSAARHHRLRPLSVGPRFAQFEQRADAAGERRRPRTVVAAGGGGVGGSPPTLRRRGAGGHVRR
ncbi:hypothetical protein ACFYWN_33845 [Streptomyces sp. NPDC002917]|uniref:hypothetical protein n=1 Tax=unclassified Streptomyces TaxID=2593676 RepID=UPI0036825896|nr:hypothetical protein OHB03_39155 [Streptomyces sp. NBC_01643]